MSDAGLRSTGPRRSPIPRYDVLPDEPWPADPVHAAPIAELTQLGFRPLCALASNLGLTSTVTVDETGTIAASFTTYRGEARPYLVTRLADGSVLETQRWPRFAAWKRGGPGFMLDDRPARLWKRFVRDPSMASVLAAHAELVARHATRSPAVAWDVARYRSFRVRSQWLLRYNHAARDLVSACLLVSTWLAVLFALLARRPGWIASGLVLLALGLSTVLFLERLLEWVAGALIRFLSVERRGQAYLIDENEKGRL